MKEELITFETAVLAKENGFNWKTRDAFVNTELTEEFNTEDNSRETQYIKLQNHNEKSHRYSRPSQSLLQRWLREVHELHIAIYPIKDYWECDVRDCNFNKRVHQSNYTLSNFPTYETALEAALQTALKLIV